MGTNTDPHQWVEGRYRLMPGVWEALRDSGTPGSSDSERMLLGRVWGAYEPKGGPARRSSTARCPRPAALNDSPLLIRAAERGGSVSGLVAEYLRSVSDRESEFARLETEQRELQRGIDRFSARNRLDRDEIHDRAVR